MSPHHFLPAWSLCFSLLLATSASLFSASYEDLVRRGDLLDEQNRNKEAMELYLQAAELREPDAELLRRKAKQLAQQVSDTPSKGERRRLALEAVDLAERAVALEPENANARLALAICYGRLAQYESPRAKMELSRRIEEEARIASRLNPRLDYAWHVLGRWHFEVVSLNTALRSVAQLVYGRLPEASLEKAVEYLERAKSVGPPRVVHHIELGRAYLAMGRTEEGRRQIEAGLALPSKEKDDEETKARGREALRSS
jgi:tetratricopeptide (TPR) repeat protein